MLCLRQTSDDPARVGGEAIWGEKVLSRGLPVPQGSRQRLLWQGHVGREKGWRGSLCHQGS